MRDFGQPVGAEMRTEILELAQEIFREAEPKRTVRARDFAMEENPDQEVVDEVDLRHDHERLRIALTRPEARPPFEWLLEITSDIGESEYFKHYLIRDHDVVLAQRKVLTPVDAEEAALILSDLRTVQDWLAD
jgi:hypothetical protein